MRLGFAALWFWLLTFENNQYQKQKQCAAMALGKGNRRRVGVGVPGSRRDFGAGWYVGKPIMIFSFI